MDAPTAHTYRQLWHLTEDARPFTSRRRTWTRRDTGNLLIWQLDGGGQRRRTLTGQTVAHPGLDLAFLRTACTRAGHRATADVASRSAS